MIDLQELKPKQKHRIYDILQELQFDMSDWKDSLKDPQGNPASNPKYCFNWSFVREDKKVVVLNLWHEEIQVDGDLLYQEHKFKEYALQQDVKRRERSFAIDRAIKLAYHEAIPVHVVICAGSVRKGESGVKKRELDSERWFVTAYDLNSGACVIERGEREGRKLLVDQFETKDLDGRANQYEYKGVTYIRSSIVRKNVLKRANGRCEYCGCEGFITNAGGQYLETHHIVPLSEGGEDTEQNVIALCPNDHRRAHYEKESVLSRECLKEVVIHMSYK